MKHTPGPWVAHWFEKNKRCKTGEWIFVGRHGTDAGSLAGGQKNVSLSSLSNEGRANAALIAAAPDLLAALELLRSGHDAGARALLGHLVDRCNCEFCHAADAAIAKARGSR